MVYLQCNAMPSIAVAELIKPAFLNLILGSNLFLGKKIIQFELRNEAAMRMFHPDEPSSPSRNEMRSILRALSDEARNRFNFLVRIGRAEKASGWVKYVIPLIKRGLAQRTPI